MNPTIPNHSIEMEQLATYVFLQNTANNVIYLDIQGIENTKDAFCMCLDLFLKGFVLLYGEGGRLDVDCITQESFAVICGRLRLAGIAPKLNMEPYDPDEGMVATGADVLRQSLYALYAKPDNLPMPEYTFSLKIGDHVCTVSFEFIRV